MGKIGFGSYRISVKSSEHKAALIKALSLGCTLIDTSANYTNGESEILIGEVLQEHPEFKPIITTKAGYIQGKNLALLAELNDKGLALSDLVIINEQLKHSIHPDFLLHQLDESLKRLKLQSIDYFLLHNPEYYFQSPNANAEEYYNRIKKAFIFLEEEVKKGRIKAYGISSNNFVLPLNHPEVTDLNKILQIKKELNAENFKVIQFPFNLIEIGALEKLGEYGDASLLELSKEHGIITMINRPLNAFTQDKLIRLATYDIKLDEESAEKCFQHCMDLIAKKWEEESSLEEKDGLNEIEMIKQFKAMWKTLPTPDAVEQVYLGHLFPFIARIWGGNLSATEARPFYQLLDFSLLYSRVNLSNTALNFKKQAEAVGLLPIDEAKPFATMTVETYLDYGFDYVLVGMKKTEYVDQLRHLF